jgi:hypothetical protein
MHTRRNGAQINRTTRRLMFAGGLCLIYAMAVIAAFAASGGVGSGLTPDTASYLELSPYRQPLYGLWANSIHTITGSWPAVLYIQVALFVLAICWVVLELAAVSRWGLAAAMLMTGVQLVLLKMGMMSLTASLVSEGLFYFLIVLSGALLLLWLRKPSSTAVVALVLLQVMITQLRSAALLVGLVPVIAGVVAVIAYGRRSSQALRGAMALTVTLVAALLLPLALGKGAFHLGTRASALGFAALPRVALLPPSSSVAVPDPSWPRMSASWRQAAAGLDPIELSQFDAQLQEAMRFYIAPRVLLPSVLGLPARETERLWADGQLYGSGADIAARWIRDQWPTYLRLSAMHFWGAMTMGNYMSESQRTRVWQALQHVDPETWTIATWRTDYPLNQIFKPLSAGAKVVNYALRWSAILFLCLAIWSACMLGRDIYRRAPLASGTLALALAFAWVVAHTIAVALLVFPEFRFTYANYLALSIGAFAWLAYCNTDPDRIAA